MVSFRADEHAKGTTSRLRPFHSATAFVLVAVWGGGDPRDVFREQLRHSGVERRGVQRGGDAAQEIAGLLKVSRRALLFDRESVQRQPRLQGDSRLPVRA